MAKLLACEIVSVFKLQMTQGHDFRPAYRRLSALRQALPATPLMALTATATLQVRQVSVESVGHSSCVHTGAFPPFLALHYCRV